MLHPSMDGRERRFNSGCRILGVLSGFLLLHSIPLCAHVAQSPQNSAETLETNISVIDDKVNSSWMPSGEAERTATAPSSALPLLLNLRGLRMPRAGDEQGSGMAGESEISSESAEKDLLLKIPSEGIGAGLPTVLAPHHPTDAHFNDEEHTEATWQGAKTGPDTAMLDLDRQPRPSRTPAPPPSHPDVLTVDYIDPASRHRNLDPPSPDPADRELQGGESWTLSDFYYYDNKDDSFSTTEVYPDADQYTTVDMEDENIMLLTTARSVPYDPSFPGSFIPDDVEGPPRAPGLVDGANGSDCRLGYVRSNGTCRSPCDLFPNYCYNAGQCYLAEGIGVFCRCNAQDYMWHKGSRCEAVITEFQVMCIAIGAAALMVLLLFMITVFFAKKLHLLRTENNRLHKRSSKYRPPSEQHNDNFSLSTIAEGSHPNKTMNRYTWECKTKEESDSEDDPSKLEDPVKVPPPKEDEPLNIQNSLTPKHDNNHMVNEENSSEVNSLQNNMM